MTTPELYQAWQIVAPLHSIWRKMLSRCENQKAQDYARYGGRGIKVHEPWHDFKAFLADVLSEIGPRPVGAYASGTPLYSFDRINNDGHYQPRNVRWATAVVQVNNRRPVRKLDVQVGERLGRVVVLGEVAPVTEGVLPSGAPRLHRAVQVRCDACGAVRVVTLSNLLKLKRKIEGGWLPSGRCYCARTGTRLAVCA
jgi:hypothetical protein